MTISSKFLFIMDRYETLNMETETSLLLMEELIRRGAMVFWVEPVGLSLRQNTLVAKARPVHSVTPMLFGEIEELSADRFDAIVPRTDPPFDDAYLHLTYLLDFVPEHVRQFNPASALRSFNEKLLPLLWPDLVPPTVTTSDASEIMQFLEEHGEIVLKPLGDCSGRGITKLSARDRHAQIKIEKILRNRNNKGNFLQAQAFLPSIEDGDKRVFLLDGEPIGMVNRVPVPGNYLANIHQGAAVEAAVLTRAEQEAIKRIGPFLKREGLLMVGADFIGGKLTELNITSPSAVRQINAVMGREIHPQIVDRMLEKVSGAKEYLTPDGCTYGNGRKLCCA